MTPQRCGWVNLANPLYVRYHDEEWGVPVRDDGALFELLCLEGAQAGLSWETVLNKREGYRRAFRGFDPEAIEALTPDELEALAHDPGIVRHRGKIASVVTNARAFRELVDATSFAAYVQGFVGATPRVNRFRDLAELPARTAESDALAKDLKRRGFKFVGSTICYAFLQAAGFVDDHLQDCFRAQPGDAAPGE
ncbi:MAG: DNA-3-methyladenine glycosylase I [Planctomycetota bacterium]